MKGFSVASGPMLKGRRNDCRKGLVMNLIIRPERFALQLWLHEWSDLKSRLRTSITVFSHVKLILHNPVHKWELNETICNIDNILFINI